MASTEVSHNRLAQLPGFDTAPDVYETPDLNDTDTTTSTLQTSQGVPSEASDTSEEDDEDERYETGVSRRRLYPERARSRFGVESRGVDSRGVDLSDRIDGRRKGYRRWRGVEVDEEEGEGLQARIARLRREVEECRALAQAEEDDEEGDEEEGEGDRVDNVDALSKLLADIAVSPATRKSAKQRRGSVFHDAPAIPTSRPETDEDEDMSNEQTLSKISAFDTRLSALESSLGLTSLLAEEDSLSTPLLSTLSLLDQQLATLTSATSLSALEAASSRIAKLKAEAQQLSSIQSHTPVTSTGVASRPGSAGTTSSSDQEPTPTVLNTDDMKKLKSLYTVLPTLQSLSPTVPALITRLRTLRTLHTTAANASEDLDALELRQSEMDRELKLWREGLEKVEEAVDGANNANGRNGSMVKGWVGDLQERLKALGR